ncbi:MAG TPA: ABC transporter permease [Pirellulaceae bacterium]|nr:ABC transporter permease [Pirellulaceae bacterium]
MLSKILREHTTLLVLLLLGAALSVATLAEQHPTGASGGKQLARRILAQSPRPQRVLIVVGGTPEDAQFAAAAEEMLAAGGASVAVVRGQPADARQAIDQAIAAGRPPQAIGATNVTRAWGVFDKLGQRWPALAGARVVAPASYWWPNFLKTANLVNVVNQVSDIAIVAIGMTMVIIAGGIDLSVGSLIALAAIIMTKLIRDYCGGVEAGAAAVVLCAAAAIAASGAIGGCTGLLVTRARIPPFIVTLGVMSIASGAASIVSRGETIDQVPRAIGWLGRGADLGVPNTTVLMLLLYVIADVVMKRTTFGRYLYAVGGNRQAAWLSGVPVDRVVTLSYVISAALAALAGVMQVSLFHSGKPTFGKGYELQVIAAVVVGGTSLAGGEGKMFGTLLGALIIAVVQNGMNLLGLGGEWQPVVLGAVILAAALIDRLKRRREE